MSQSCWHGGQPAPASTGLGPKDPPAEHAPIAKPQPPQAPVPVRPGGHTTPLKQPSEPVGQPLLGLTPAPRDTAPAQQTTPRPGELRPDVRQAPVLSTPSIDPHTAVMPSGAQSEKALLPARPPSPSPGQRRREEQAVPNPTPERLPSQAAQSKPSQPSPTRAGRPSSSDEPVPGSAGSKPAP